MLSFTLSGPATLYQYFVTTISGTPWVGVPTPVLTASGQYMVSSLVLSSVNRVNNVTYNGDAGMWNTVSVREASNMSLIVNTVFIWALTIPIAACQNSAVPLDVRAKTLDPRNAVQEADSIVFAYPVSQRDVREVFVPFEGRPEPMRLEETETTLKTLLVLKGAPLPAQIRFRYYDTRGYVQVGPPQGPSGHMGSRGIFFLKQQADGSFRSAVDVYRPDIPTPWILGSREAEPCASSSDCVAKFLLTYHESDDELRSQQDCP